MRMVDAIRDGELMKIAKKQISELFTELNFRLMLEFGITAFQDMDVLWVESIEMFQIQD